MAATGYLLVIGGLSIAVGERVGAHPRRPLRGRPPGPLAAVGDRRHRDRGGSPAVSGGRWPSPSACCSPPSASTSRWAFSATGIDDAGGTGRLLGPFEGWLPAGAPWLAAVRDRTAGRSPAQPPPLLAVVGLPSSPPCSAPPRWRSRPERTPIPTATCVPWGSPTSRRRSARPRSATIRCRVSPLAHGLGVNGRATAGWWPARARWRSPSAARALGRCRSACSPPVSW